MIGSERTGVEYDYGAIPTYTTELSPGDVRVFSGMDSKRAGWVAGS